MAKTAPAVEVIGALIPSGHCSFPQTEDPTKSHERCAANGGGSRANPKKVFNPCPCSCHYGEEYECGGCGRTIVECLAWPFDVDGDMHYTHVDARGWATGEECGTVSRNTKRPEAVVEEPEVIDLQAGWDALTQEERDAIREEAVFIEVPADPEPDEDDEFAAMLAEFDMDD